MSQLPCAFDSDLCNQKQDFLVLFRLLPHLLVLFQRNQQQQHFKDNILVACSCAFQDASATDWFGETAELLNPPGSLKPPVWQRFAFTVSYANNERVVDRKTAVWKLSCRRAKCQMRQDIIAGMWWLFCRWGNSSCVSKLPVWHLVALLFVLCVESSPDDGWNESLLLHLKCIISMTLVWIIPKNVAVISPDLFVDSENGDTPIVQVTLIKQAVIFWLSAKVEITYLYLKSTVNDFNPQHW